MAQQHLAQDLVNFDEYHFEVPGNSSSNFFLTSDYAHRELYQNCNCLGGPFNLVVVLDWTLLSIDPLSLQECFPLPNPYSPIWMSFLPPHFDVPLPTAVKRLQFHHHINDEYYFEDQNGSHKRKDL